MPDAANAPQFWTQVATTFADDDGVLFEPYNEPFTASWGCWRDGCVANQAGLPRGAGPLTYMAAGMQALINAIRQGESGAPHVLLLGGLAYSNDLSQWLAYEPTDPRATATQPSNLAAAWHIYDFNACVNPSCWDRAPALVASMVPVVATEIGERDCSDGFISQSSDGGGAGLMQWLDQHGLGYLGWSWNSGQCLVNGQPFAIITDYYSPTPNSVFATTFRDHIALF